MSLLHRALVAFCAIILLGAIPGTEAQAERFKLRDLHPEIRGVVMTYLEKKGVAPNNQITMGVTTADCPSDCGENAKIRGGMCLCKPPGECSGGSLTLDGFCRVKPDKVVVGGGELGGQAEVLTSDF